LSAPIPHNTGRGGNRRGGRHPHDPARHPPVKHSHAVIDSALLIKEDMPRNTLKQFLPSPARIKQVKGLHLLGDWVYAPSLWHINRYSASMAFFVGLFISFMPMPGQTILAAMMAIWLRCNLPLSVALVFISNPVTMPPMFFMAYKVGAMIVQAPVQPLDFELSFHWLGHELAHIWKPFLLGCLLCGLSLGSLGYFAMSMVWRWHVTHKWHQRKHRRKGALPSGPG